MKKKIPYLVIVFAALLLVLPNLITRQMVMGSDSVFHFNRFYDTAMQIKTGNFQYFISLFGFQQSGRIVNPFYGPLWAYLNGGLVLLAGTWFRYQVLSNFLLYVLSGTSLFLLLKKAHVSLPIRLPLSLFFMTTFSIQYWIERQGFTSWGTAVLPLCLIPVIDMVEKKQIPILKLALSMALMAQIHLFTSLLLAVIYAGYFVYSFVKCHEKGRMLKHLFAAIGLFILLTANLWTALFYLYRGNTILSPFINRDMSSFAVDTGSDYWLFYPYPLLILMGIAAVIFIVRRKEMSVLTGITGLLALLFLFLSSDLLPWNTMVSDELPFVSLIQFPFRFFAPFTVLFLFFSGKTLQAVKWDTRNFLLLFSAFALLGMGQVLFTTTETLARWQTENYAGNSQIHTYVDSNTKAVKDSFFNSDMQKSLTLVQKGTPDYLPIYQATSANNYRLYRDEIVERNPNFQKEVRNDQLTVKWKAPVNGPLALPIILYQGSRLEAKGRPISYTLSEIGTPTIQATEDIQEITLSFKAPFYVDLGIWVTLLSWIGSLSVLVWIRTHKNS
ncbi:hypothetical protein NRIC_28600 [Enterococcus florum]|uniref:Membrane protein 6-pyruvoyl-tetrahydropterin synthase-related domain-containing protein n=1 Tax=Enterococcus florum TaxID=2480627 RepID=A0A4V0WPT4_9ENTE|nr:hypothetical protein [Enterococcus florum]GCF94969.1 hypothetical protein NRIC_28600 [Enterococcus florum]